MPQGRTIEFWPHDICLLQYTMICATIINDLCQNEHKKNTAIAIMIKHVGNCARFSYNRGNYEFLNIFQCVTNTIDQLVEGVLKKNLDIAAALNIGTQIRWNGRLFISRSVLWLDKRIKFWINFCCRRWASALIFNKKLE